MRRKRIGKFCKKELKWRIFRHWKDSLVATKVLFKAANKTKVGVEFLIFQQKHSITYSILCFLWFLFWEQCFRLSFQCICLLFVWSSPCPHQHIHKGPEQSLQVVAIISPLTSFEGASSCIKVLPASPTQLQSPSPCSHQITKDLCLISQWLQHRPSPLDPCPWCPKHALSLLSHSLPHVLSGNGKNSLHWREAARK